MFTTKKIMPFIFVLAITLISSINIPVASAEDIPTYTTDEYYSSASAVYASNPLAFSKKFNHRIIVTGEIISINEGSNVGFGITYSVVLKGSEGEIMCHFDSNQKSDIANLVVGQEVSIQGMPRASKIVRSIAVGLTKCKVNNAVSTANKTPDFTITAHELQKLFFDNVLDATLNYKDKIGLVSGTVLLVGNDFNGRPQISLREASALDNSVYFTFAEEDAASIAKIRVGQKLSIIGTLTSGDVYSVGFTDCSISAVGNSNQTENESRKTVHRGLKRLLPSIFR